jgi:hypothetical protein
VRTPEADPQPGQTGVGAAAKQVAEHASALARLELELAAIELKRKAAALGLGAALLIGAAVCCVFLLGFALAALAAGLATFVATWVALLIVTGGLALIVALLGLVGLATIRKGTPPVPEQALAEARKTSDALRSSNGGA